MMISTPEKSHNQSESQFVCAPTEDEQMQLIYGAVDDDEVTVVSAKLNSRLVVFWHKDGCNSWYSLHFTGPDEPTRNLFQENVMFPHAEPARRPSLGRGGGLSATKTTSTVLTSTTPTGGRGQGQTATKRSENTLPEGEKSKSKKIDMLAVIRS